MKILVTGASGMLGQDLVPRLASQHTVIPTDSDTLDITQADSIATKLKTEKPDLLLNCAAYTNVDGAESNEDLAYQINAVAVKKLAQACHEHHIWFITISTDYVFDGKNSAGYTEDAARDPLAAYGRTKAAGEQWALEIYPEQTIIVRTAWLYGRHGKNFVETMLSLANEKPELKVVNDQVGCPTSTLDLSRQLLKLVNKIDEGKISSSNNPQILHFVSEGRTSWYDFTRKIFELSSIITPVQPCTSAEYPRPAKRPAYSVLLNTRFEPLPTWEEELKEYLDLRG